MNSFDDIKKYLKENNNEHLLKFYDELSDIEKENLINQIKLIDFKYMKTLFDNSSQKFNSDNKEITNMPVIDKNKIDTNKYKLIGEDLIKQGKVAVCSMAGGQGSRLGYNGPKGTYILDIDKPISIFETIIIKLKDAYKQYGVLIYCYIMTSELNNDETISFFEKNNYFDYDKEHIKFFKQAELPLLDKEGKVILKDKSNIFFAPDGNGGIFEALGKNEIIKHMKEHNINYLSIGNVDNILINMVDPIAIGLMSYNKADILSKSFIKPSPEGKWGVFCKINGKVSVIEYSDTPKELLSARDKNGELIFGDAHFGNNFFDVSFLEKVINEKLPMHTAIKKNTYINENCETITNDTYKFEAFIFDVFSASDNVLIYRVNKDDEFAPIKNKEGDESPETAVKLYKDFYNKLNS